MEKINKFICVLLVILLPALFVGCRTYDYHVKLLEERTQTQIPWIISAGGLFLFVLILAFVMFQRKRQQGRLLETLVRQRTNELMLQTSTLQTVVDSIPDLIFCKDLNSTYTLCNKFLEDYFGVDKENLVGKGDVDGLKFPAEVIEKIIPVDRKVISDAQRISYEEWIPSFDGSKRLFETIKAPLIQKNGAVVGLVGIARDITERKRMEEEAIFASRAKSNFLATMSHEIRTPMNAILGISEIQLQNETLDQAVRESFDRIYASGDLLLGIINDILDLSKVESGKLGLMIDQYEIASLISDTAQLNMMRIGSKPIEFELHIDENVPMLLLGDELRVKQILNNLLSNAFKYTAAGTVRFSVSVEPHHGDDENQVTLAFNVSDTGQGMTKEQVSKLFDEYSRFNTEANRTTEGTGLGMSITQNLIQLMGGEISIESEPGKGSTFTVRLPQGRVGSDMLGRELAKNLQKFRTSSRAQMKRVQITREPMPYGNVLIVDDVETNIYVAKGLLAVYELNIDSTDSGLGAIEKIKNGKVYDIVFMDHMMPNMDGMEATKIIREMGYQHAIVALTANAVVGQADLFLENGFDDYLSKPIDVRQLNTMLNKLIRNKQPPEVIEEARRQAEARNEQSSKNEPQLAIKQKFAELFVRDASKAIAVLEEINEKGRYNEEEMRMYVIHVHGMKSALANIGNMQLSSVALKLETSGRDGNIEVISSETPAFLGSLRAVVEKLSPKKVEGSTQAVDEDLPHLHEKLLAIKTAMESYNKKAAKDALRELREKTWSQPTEELLNEISEHLLHGDFDEVGRAADNFLEVK